MLKSEAIAELLRRSKEQLEEDPFCITPCPDLDELASSGSASVDLRLGTWFVVLRQARIPCLRINDASSESSLTKTAYVPFGKDFFLHPGSFVLGVTLEWLRFPGDLAAYVIGKSSWGRRGLVIATATAVHPGFTGCLTLELSNVGEIPVALKPGTPICQLCLHKLSVGEQSSADRSRFVGQRKPRLGKIVFDPLAQALSEAYSMDDDQARGDEHEARDQSIRSRGGSTSQTTNELSPLDQLSPLPKTPSTSSDGS